MLFHLWGHLICNAYTTPDRPQLLPSASMSLKKSLLPCISHVSRLVVSDSLRPHEIKRRLLPGRKVMTHLDSILKSRDITLSTKVRLVKAMVFPEVMYGCESWTIKKAERWRIHAFEQGCSLEGLMLKLKRQYFGHLMRRTDSLEKTLKLGGIGGRRRRGRQRRRWLDGITDSMGVGLSSSGRCDGQGAWHAASRGVAKCWTRLSNWTTTKPAWPQSHGWGRGALLSPSPHSFCFKENQMLCQAGKTSCWGALCPPPPCLMVEWAVLVERPGLPLVSFVFGRKGDELSEQAVHLQRWLKGVGLWFRTKQWAAQRARKG